MSGHGAILVLERARGKAGDPHFMGSRAEAIRLSAIELDEDHGDAVRLMGLLPYCPAEVMLKRVDASASLGQAQARRRMCDDFTAGIAKLLTVADSIRAIRGRAAAKSAQNWANAKPVEQRDAEWSRTFADAHKDAAREIGGPK